MKIQDCFNWDSYTKSHYESEMSMLTKKYNLDFIIDNFVLENEEIVFKNNLHNNWMELYHQIHKLKVSSVYECGCGNAHHWRRRSPRRSFGKVRSSDLVE